jgi:S1-C subfamily serine protease
MERAIVNRVVSGLLTIGLTGALSVSAAAGLPSPEPFVTLLDMHPVEGAFSTPAPTSKAAAMPTVVRQGQASGVQEITMPVVVTPAHPADDDAGGVIGKAGTGFFIGDDGTLLTAAHVASGCGRMQIISRYVARAWVSVLATDEAHDIAVLKAPGVRPPSVVRLASTAPTSGKLFILGFPASASLTVPAETWGVMQNERFPANVGSLANPKDLLWMSAPDVSRGYSGGPIFDPRTGAVVGLVKGEVDGGYLRLIRDMPTTGIAIGPGIGQIGALVRHEVGYAALSLASSPGEAGVETLRRATVHVLCWH